MRWRALSVCGKNVPESGGMAAEIRAMYLRTPTHVIKHELRPKPMQIWPKPARLQRPSNQTFAEGWRSFELRRPSVGRYEAFNFGVPTNRVVG